jgi:ssDNA-binding replication factor A large subunit
MNKKEDLMKELIEKSGKNSEEIKKLIDDKVNELSGLVSEEGAIYIIANELGIRLESEKPKKKIETLKLEEINEPNMQVSFYGKVLKKYDLINFTSQKGNQGSVQSILIGDESGIKRVTFWNENTEKLKEIENNDLIKIENAYTRENSQNPERIDIHFSQYSELEKNPEGIKIEVKKIENEFTPTKKKINEIEENDKNIELFGLITDFDIPRYYNACPECFKKVFQEEDKQICPNHEEVEAIKVPIVNLTIDDGTGNISIVGFRDRAEKITQLTSDEIIKLTEDFEEYRKFSKKIVGSNLNLIGNVSISSLTSEKQILINEIIEIDFKKEEVDEKNNQLNKNNNEEDIIDMLDEEIEEISDDDLI